MPASTRFTARSYWMSGETGSSSTTSCTPSRRGRSPILLTERKDHLAYLAERLRDHAPNLVVLHGGMTDKERRDLSAQLATLPAGAKRLVLATGRYIGEGFDDARLDTLFLAMPLSMNPRPKAATARLPLPLGEGMRVREETARFTDTIRGSHPWPGGLSWKGTLVQYTGRLHRRHPAKRDVRIFDYADSELPVLRRMFEKRLKTYRAIGYVWQGVSAVMEELVTVTES